MPDFNKEDLQALPVSGSNGLRAVCRQVCDELNMAKNWTSSAKRDELIKFLENPDGTPGPPGTNGEADEPVPVPGEPDRPNYPKESPGVGEKYHNGFTTWSTTDDCEVRWHCGRWIWHEQWDKFTDAYKHEGEESTAGCQAYPAEAGESWDESGDAVQIDESDKKPGQYLRDGLKGADASFIIDELEKPGANPMMAQAIETLVRLMASSTGDSGPSEGRVRELIDERVKKAKPQVHLVKVERTELPPLELDVVHPVFTLALACLQQRIPVYLQGASGGGKTTMAKQLAEALSLDYTPYTVGPSTEEHHLLGMKWPTKEGPVYSPGVFYGPYKDGGLILLDELDNGGPDVNVNLNHLLANGECRFPNDELVTAHENFCIVGGANTLGLGGDRQYIRNQQDAAFLDRWAFIKMPYDDGIEKAMAGCAGAGTKPPRIVDNEPYDGELWFERVKKIRKAVTDLGERVVVSPRAILFGRKLMEGASIKRELVENVLVWNKMGDDVAKRIKNKLKEK